MATWAATFAGGPLDGTRREISCLDAHRGILIHHADGRESQVWYRLAADPVNSIAAYAYDETVGPYRPRHDA